MQNSLWGGIGMKCWPFSGHQVIPHQPHINWSEQEHNINNIASLTKFRFFESNLDTWNTLLLHFSPSLCWEIRLIDPLIPSLMTWLHRSQVTKCCLVSGSITEVSLISPLSKENVRGVAIGVLGIGISECVWMYVEIFWSAILSIMSVVYKIYW